MSQPHDEWFHKLATLRIDMLSETECAAFEEHIQSCALCQEQYAQYCVIDEKLRHYFSLPVLPAEPPPLPATLQARALEEYPKQARSSDALAYMKQFIAAFGMQSVIIALSVGLITFALGIYVMQHSSSNIALIAPLANIAIAAVILGIVMRRGLVLREEWSNPTAGRHYFSSSSPTTPIRFPSQGENFDPVAEVDPSLHDPLPVLKHSTPEKLWHDRGRLLIISLTLLAVGVASLSIALVSPPSKSPASRMATSQVNTATTPPIGISSTGNKVFDTNRKDVDLKQAAATYVAHGDFTQARQQWQQALLVDSDDAEVLIYLENQQVSDEVKAAPSHFEYRTLVVFTTLAQDHLGGGRDILQGAYVAQKEHNDQVRRTGGVLLRLLIAVTNKDQASIRDVTLQVVKAAHTDPSILGVMGLPTSNIALVAEPLLSAAHLPMVSPTASSMDLSGQSPYFFRVAPPDTVQGQVGARYAKEQMHVKTVAVFVNDSDSYSRSLAQAFESNFADPQHTVIQLYYQQGQPETIEAGFQRAEQLVKKPDLIYFAGFVNDASVLLQLLPACSNPNSCLKVMGGDALYVQRDYSLDAYKGYSRLIFTAFAFSDAWEKQGATQEPLFFQEYAHNFDPSGQYQPGKYGFNRADADAILSYDAMQAFLHGIAQLSAQHERLTPDTLLTSLQQIDASHAFQGVSRKIAFDSNGNPTDDQIVILAGAADAQTNLVGIYPGTTK
ncbi:MAG TPA: ABC transporter substrate-binding protein [Ktedonobacteraceae bacterium]|jgi:ABC-type branched-subunit amino acid transport system substrate-binding protein|nr:ABC transporter substrate-binding protein [Ktedonobacteraceae bacterium]